MARSGRKRDINAKRRQTTAAGRGYRREVGSFELRVRKSLALGRTLRLVNGEIVGLVSNYDDASSPAVVLRAQGWFNRPGDTDPETSARQKYLVDAAEHYAWLYWRCIGKPWAKTASVEGSFGCRTTFTGQDDRETYLERRFSGLREALKAAGPKAHKAATELCVDFKWPKDAGTCHDFTVGDFRLADAVAGLEVMVDWLQGNRKSPGRAA